MRNYDSHVLTGGCRPTNSAGLLRDGFFGCNADVAPLDAPDQIPAGASCVGSSAEVVFSRSVFRA